MDPLIDDIAADLGVTAEARRKWRERGRIAHRWRLPILREAWRRGVDLPEDVFADPSETLARGHDVR